MQKRLIAHRGNMRGPNREKENSPDYIQAALDMGFDVEIDLWVTAGPPEDNGGPGKSLFWLGHDGAQHQVEFEWILMRAERLWIHCKNHRALAYMMMLNPAMFNYFWHDKDAYTLTSQGKIWAYPTSIFIKGMIIAVPETEYPGEMKTMILSNPLIAGICSDYVGMYKSERVLA